jgi:hypothetical protein
MRRTALIALVILVSLAPVSCGGGSDPTTPSPAGNGGTSGGSGGGTSGGGTGGGTPTFRVATPVTDSFFDDNDWDDIVETSGAGGTGGGGHLTFNGQAGAGYRQVSISITSGGSKGKLAVFAINRQALYFPSSDGAILWIDYSESSINQSSGSVQYSAPAIRQNGKLYTLMPGDKAFATPDSSWTDHAIAHLTQNDFRTIASAADHPDFSRSGTRMEFGFMRMQLGFGQSKAGIDNFLMTLFRE